MRTMARAPTLAPDPTKDARFAGSAGSKASKLLVICLRDAAGLASSIPVVGALVAPLRYTWADA